MARPTDYLPEYPQQAHKLALLGATDKEMADFFEVNPDTIYEWKKKYPAFSESIRDGKIKADSHVAAKLYDRAIGAEWVEDAAFKVKKIEYGDGGKKISEYEEVITVPVRKSAPPDTAAITRWLTNRQSDKWQEKVDMNLGGQKDNPVVVTLPENDRAALEHYYKTKLKGETKDA